MARSRYSLEDRERGLAALVIAGSSIRASEVTGIPDKTLRDWRQQDPERYETLRHELEPQVAKAIAAEAEHLTQRVFAIEHKILDSFTDDEIDALKPADKASALRNLQTVAALGIDKLSSPLRERPSHVPQNIGIEELVTRFRRVMGLDAIQVPNEATSELPSSPLPPESAALNA